MAALNTLRTRGGVLLSVVIGISLLAFLLGDGIGLFERKNVIVAEINGNDLSYNEYSAEVDMLTTVRSFLTRKTSLTQKENDYIRSQAWQRMINKYAIIPSYKALGLGVYDNEMLDMVSGKYISPVLSGLFADQQTGYYDKAMVDNFVASLDYDMQDGGKRRVFWSNIKHEMKDSRMGEKYNALVAAGMFVTQLQIEQGLVNNADQYNIQYVAKSINTISDESITVTDKDLRAYYDKHIKRFERNDGIDIEYVVFDVEPSDADYAQATQQAARMTVELRESKDAAQYVNYNSESKFNPIYWNANELPDNIKSQIGTAVEGQTFNPILEDDIYSISRVNNIKTMPDSIELRSVYVSTTANIDSLIAVIKNSPKGFDQVVASSALKSDGTEAGKIDPGKLDPKYADKLQNTTKGNVFVFDVEGAKQLVQVVSVDKNVKKYQIAVVEFKVTPSDETAQDSYNKATDFINTIQKEGKSFEAAVSDNAYIKRTASLTPDSREIRGLNNSLEMVRWAFTNKNGAVSTIFDTQGANVVAFVKSVNVKGYASFDEVKELIRPQYIEKAKMDMAVKELSGASSLAELAAKEDLSVISATDLNFNQSYVPGIGLAPEVIGALPSLKEGVVSAGIPATGNAVAVMIDGKSPREGMDASKVKVLLETSATSYMDARLGSALSSMLNIKDNRVIYL